MTPPEAKVLSRERILENETVDRDLLPVFNNMHKQLENLQEELEPLVADYEKKKEAFKKVGDEMRWAQARKEGKEKAIDYLEGQIDEMKGTKDRMA